MDAQQLKLVMDMQRKANLEMMEQMSRMFAQLLPTNGQSSPAAPTAESRKVSIMDSLSARLPTFAYDKDHQCTFDSWYSRYEDLIEKEGSELDDATKARLVLLKLDAHSYALFTSLILPKKPADLKLEEVVKMLRQHFGDESSVFRRRFEYINSEYQGNGLDEYDGQVKRRFNHSEWNLMNENKFNASPSSVDYAQPNTMI
uniref:DUF7083 domain-containing protein n=1 Tax=Caenorhabditis japonica TaxID=281687 RepID=A0A8R1I9S6_CAEJA